MAAVAVLMGEDTSWASIRKMIANKNEFCSRLDGYDKDNVRADTLRELRKYTRLEGFSWEEVRKNSAAAGDVAAWVIAIDHYNAQQGK